MIELTKEQEEEWIKFGEEASERTSKGPLHSKEFGTGKNRYEVHFKGFSIYQDRYEDKNETWFDYWIADNLEHLDDQIGEENTDNQHLPNDYYKESHIISWIHPEISTKIRPE